MDEERSSTDQLVAASRIVRVIFFQSLNSPDEVLMIGIPSFSLFISTFIMLLASCSLGFFPERVDAIVHVPTFETKKNPFIGQIQADLAPFKKNSVTAKNILDTMNELPEGMMAAIYRIDSHEASIIASKNQATAQYIVTSLMLRGFQEFVAFCQKNSLRIPEVEFVVYIDDWTTTVTPYSAPLFVFAKDTTRGQGLVVLPDFEMLSGYEEIAAQTLDACEKSPWKHKKEMVIWRGTTTGSPHNGSYTPSNFRDFPRTKLVDLSLANPDIVDARFTKLCQGAELFAAQLSKYCGNFMPIWGHIPYKYQILVDGNTCAFSRAYWQLLSNCVMFKQTSSHIQWYYRGLKPYVHYVPVKEDLSDLISQVKWARSHDKKVHLISKNATAFAQENLTKDEAFTYLHRLFVEYEKLLYSHQKRIEQPATPPLRHL
jgi:hypothetical protein